MKTGARTFGIAGLLLSFRPVLHCALYFFGRGVTVTVVFIQHRVADFDTWYKGYQGATAIQDAGGVTDKAVYRTAGNPNLVLVMHQFGSRDQAESFLGDDKLRAAQESAGVDLSSVRVEFYEPV